VTLRHGGWAAAFFCALLAAAAALAQQPARQGKPYALIFGTVYAPGDRPAYGAQVRVRRTDGKKLKGGEDLVSDHQGEFALRVPAEPADYVVRATAREGKRRLGAETKVHVNFDERVDISLHLTE
jgi:hypothetical protein